MWAKSGEKITLQKQNTLSLLEGRVFILNLAETRRFELLKAFIPHLVSSEAH
jgi:hypothetical protein